MRSKNEKSGGDAVRCLVDLSPISDKYVVELEWDGGEYAVKSSIYIADADGVFEHDPSLKVCGVKRTKRVMRDVVFLSDFGEIDRDAKEADLDLIMDNYASFKMRAKRDRMGRDAYYSECIKRKKLLE